MGGSLGPVLANIIMNEYEKVTFEELMKEKVNMFYTRYVDDTLLIIKFNSYHKNLRFIVENI